MGPFRTGAVIDRFDPQARRRLEGLPGAGGSGLVALALARLSAGLPTEVITLDPQLPSTQEAFVCETDGLRLTICPRRSRHAVRDVFRAERGHILRAIAASRAPLLHAHWSYEYALAAIDSGMPALVTVHDHAGRVLRREGMRFFGHYLMARKVFRRHRHFSAVSPYVAAYVEKRARRPVPVIGNPVPSQTMEETSNEYPALSGNTCRIVTAAGWARFKNVRAALRAFAVLRKKIAAARYRLFGPGLEPDGPAAHWAARRGLNTAVTFEGPRTHAEVMHAFRTCDLAWHPSLEEACPCPVMEALSLARPVVASRQANGSAWLVEHGRTGMLADGASPAAMASMLEELYRHPDTARKIGLRGQREINRRFAARDILAAYETAYRGLTGQS